MPRYYPLTVYQGDTGRWRFNLWTDATLITPLDLAGVMVDAEIRDKAGRLLAILGSSVTLPNTIDVIITAEVSATLTSGVWELRLTWPSGGVQTVVEGSVTVMTAAMAQQRLRSVGGWMSRVNPLVGPPTGNDPMMADSASRLLSREDEAVIAIDLSFSICSKNLPGSRPKRGSVRIACVMLTVGALLLSDGDTKFSEDEMVGHA